MATKNHERIDLKYSSTADSNGGQYSSLNLNHNNRISNEVLALSENVKHNSGRKCQDDFKSGSRMDQLSSRHEMIWTSKVLDDVFGRKKEILEEKESSKSDKAVNNSTLSLHIVAYENFIGNTHSDSVEDQNLEKQKNPFEFPRQQNDQILPLPEMAQYRANQRLAGAPEQPAPLRRSQRERRAPQGYPSPGLTPVRQRRTLTPIRDLFSPRRARTVPRLSRSRSRTPPPYVRPRSVTPPQPVRPRSRTPPPAEDPRLPLSPRALANQFRPAGNGQANIQQQNFLVVTNGVYVFHCPKADANGSGIIGSEIFYENHLGRVINSFENRLDAREFTRRYAQDHFLTLKIKTRTGWLMELFPRPANDPTPQATREVMNALAAGIRTDNDQAHQAITAAIRGEMNRMAAGVRDEVAAIREENRQLVQAVTNNAQTMMNAAAEAVNTINTLFQQFAQQQQQNLGIANAAAVIVPPIPAVIQPINLPLPQPLPPPPQQPQQLADAPTFNRITREALINLNRENAEAAAFAYQLCNYCINKKESVQGVPDEIKTELYKLSYLARDATTTRAQEECRTRIDKAIPLQRNSLLNGLRGKARASSVGASVVGPTGSAIELLPQGLPVNGDEAAPEGTTFFVPKNSAPFLRTTSVPLKAWPLLLKPNREKHDYCIYAQQNPTAGQRKYSYFMIDAVEETKTALRE